MKALKKKPVPRLTPEVESLVLQGLRRTFEILAADFFQLMREQGGRDTVSGADVRDLCADYIGQYAPEAARAFYNLSASQRARLLKAAFPARSYSY